MQAHPEFGRDDVRQGGLAQTWRAEEQHVVQGLGAAARGVNEDRQLFAHLGLAHVVVQALGAQGALQGFFFGRGGSGRHQALRGGEVVGLDGHVGGAGVSATGP